MKLPHTPIPVGISACLLGNPVRHNGGHKLSTWCRDVLGPWFDYRPACPEMAAGFGTPRPTIRLLADGAATRAIQSTEVPRDVTAVLASAADDYHAKQDDLCGFIFMERSPSCGLFRVKRYNDRDNVQDTAGRGIFAAQLLAREPLLPVEEAGRLNDADLRDCFIVRVFATYEWRTEVLPQPTAQKLIAFWSRYKFLTLAHDERASRALGKLLADAGRQDCDALAREFFAGLQTALAKPSTRRGNVNALEHLRGFVKQRAEPVEKASLTRAIHQYRDGVVPLVVPMTLLRHLLEKYPDSYANAQQYLEPYPDSLSLRNHK